MKINIVFTDTYTECVTERERTREIRLDQTLGITERNLYLFAIYIPPVDSPYFEDDIFENLHSEIAYFQAQGNVFLTGDLYGRTRTEPDVNDPRV